MDDPNRLSLDLVDEAIDFADELRIGVRHLESEAAVLDFGVDNPGGIEAGVLLAELSTGGLATVQAGLKDVDGAALPQVELSTDHPELVLAGCQAASWAVEASGRETRVRGPGQLLREGAAVGLPVGTDEPDFAVLVVEADRHPDDALAEAVASAASVPPSGVFLAVAPAASVAGAVAAAARAATAAVSRLDGLGYDLGAIRSASGAAPVAPTAASEPEARARSAGAVAYGAQVHLVLDADVTAPERLVYGGSDGGRDPPPERHKGAEGLEEVLAPAQATLDVVGGPTHVVGGVEQGLLAEQLGV